MTTKAFILLLLALVGVCAEVTHHSQYAWYHKRPNGTRLTRFLPFTEHDVADVLHSHPRNITFTHGPVGLDESIPIDFPWRLGQEIYSNVRDFYSQHCPIKIEYGQYHPQIYCAESSSVLGWPGRCQQEHFMLKNGTSVFSGCTFLPGLESSEYEKRFFPDPIL